MPLPPPVALWWLQVQPSPVTPAMCSCWPGRVMWAARWRCTLERAAPAAALFGCLRVLLVTMASQEVLRLRMLVARRVWRLLEMVESLYQAKTAATLMSVSGGTWISVLMATAKSRSATPTQTTMTTSCFDFVPTV